MSIVANPFHPSVAQYEYTAGPQSAEQSKAAPSLTVGEVTRVVAPARVGQVQRHATALLCVLGLRGRARYSLPGRVFDVEPGTMLWLPLTNAPSEQLVTHDVSDDFAAWSALASGDFAARVAQGKSAELLQKVLAEGGQSSSMTRLSCRRLETHFEQLESSEPNSEGFASELAQLLRFAWSEQAKAERIDHLTDVHPAVEKAAHILRTQPETGSMQELAHVCGASPSWLSRLFRQQVGVSLVGFRNQWRIERFFELYGDGHRRNLTQTAYAAGFGSYAQFHRVFKEALGYSPGELKRIVQGTPAFGR